MPLLIVCRSGVGRCDSSGAASARNRSGGGEQGRRRDHCNRVDRSGAGRRRRSTGRITDHPQGWGVRIRSPVRTIEERVHGVGTRNTRRSTVIEHAHDDAITAAFGHLEQHGLFSRAGRGGVRQIDAERFVVARYRHRTNGEGHPQLHTHCAVLNRVWSVDTDGHGKWRTIDGRGLYRELHAAGTVYARVFEQELFTWPGG